MKRGDFSHFLSLYAPDRLPVGRRLREMMDRIVFCIEGYDDDPPRDLVGGRLDREWRGLSDICGVRSPSDTLSLTS